MKHSIGVHRSFLHRTENQKHEYRNSKWFDWPFDWLTAMSSVEWLTILSEVEGQYQMTKIQADFAVVAVAGTTAEMTKTFL